MSTLRLFGLLAQEYINFFKPSRHRSPAHIGSKSVPRFGQPEVVTVPEEQISDTQKSSRVTACNGSS